MGDLSQIEAEAGQGQVRATGTHERLDREEDRDLHGLLRKARCTFFMK